MSNSKSNVEHLVMLSEGEKFVPYNRGALSTNIYTFSHFLNGDIMAVDQFNQYRLFPADMLVEKLKSEMVSYINKNFLIRVTKKFLKGSVLVGAGQYHKLVGYKLANKHFYACLKSDADIPTFKLRRGLKIEFVSK